MSQLMRFAIGLLVPGVLLLGSASALSSSRPAAAATSLKPFALDSLLTHLARPAPSSTPFVEARFSALLTRPLIVSGKLEYLGPDALARTVDEPYHEYAEIRGGEVTVRRAGESPRHFSLERVPAMRSLLESLTALLGGRIGALERRFRLDLHGDPGEWTIGLTPRDPAIHRRIRAITASGSGLELRCLTTFQANGDVTVTLVSSAARVRRPARPGRAWFDAECHGTHAHSHSHAHGP